MLVKFFDFRIEELSYEVMIKRIGTNLSGISKYSTKTSHIFVLSTDNPPSII